MTIAEKLTAIANKMQGVYEKGVEAGKAQGGNDEYYNVFWDGFQQNGARRDYAEAFKGWKNAHNYWKPKYDMIMNGGSKVFYDFTSDIGLPELCKENGVTIDWSNVQTFGQTFSYATIPDVGVIDTRGAKGLSSIFLYADVKKAEIIMKEDGSQANLSGAFTGAKNLTDLVIRGKIGDTIDFKESKNLTKDSITSIINGLSDTTTGKTLSLSKTAVNGAFTPVNLIKQFTDEESKTENGITFTNNRDGTFTLNGTATADAEFIVSPSVTIRDGTILVKGVLERVGVEFGIYDGIGVPFYTDDGSYGEQGTTYNYGEGMSGYTSEVKIRVYAGTVVENFVVKPEIIAYHFSNSEEWQTLVASKPNWTINLA